MLHVYTFTIQKNPPTHNRIGRSGILLTHASLFPQGRKPATKRLGPTPPAHTTQHFQGEGQRASLHTTTPHLLRTTPPPPQIELLSSLYSCILYYYLYLFCFIVFYLTPVLIRFVKLCVCRDLYTTHAQPDDGKYRPKHVVVSITVTKYTSVIKLCLTTYLFLVSHTHHGDEKLPRFS